MPCSVGAQHVISIFPSLGKSLSLFLLTPSPTQALFSITLICQVRSLTTTNCLNCPLPRPLQAAYPLLWVAPSYHPSLCQHAHTLGAPDPVTSLYPSTDQRLTSCHLLTLASLPLHHLSSMTAGTLTYTLPCPQHPYTQ